VAGRKSLAITEYRLEGEQKVKIALVQVNPIIGDFAGNSDTIVAWAEKAWRLGCKLVIFPEMALSGYPPQDLLERQSFLADHESALTALMLRLPDLDVMIGCIERRHGDRGKPLYNSVVTIRAGKIVFRARKQLLPSYDVFDETRYFEPGPASELYEIDGHYFAATVCEDVWYHEIGEYDTAPVDDICQKAETEGQQLTAIINVSASPFQRGKEETRKAIFRNICGQYNLPFLYCNQVGGQDSLLFDGRSLVMDASGEVVAQAEGFMEDLIVVDTKNWRGDLHASLAPSDVESVYAALVMGVRDYTAKCGFHSAVLGLSGGIDSALTAVIAADALGATNILGVAMPSPYSSGDSLEDAEQLARNLGCTFSVIPINSLFAQFRTSLAPLFGERPEDLTEQNLQARIRGNLLMALSNKFGHLLLTTGNKSEMAVGYCTLYGDMSGGLAVISDVPKQLVYELALYINRRGKIIPERIISKAPTAELKPNQLDQDDLPPYPVLDRILEYHLEQGEGIGEIVARGFDEQIVRDILRRVRINEYKRKQAPMGLKVTTKAFGCGRRYPNTQHYRG
jgi:NAD+ synthase (glutamine-hydrolysing)